MEGKKEGRAEGRKEGYLEDGRKVMKERFRKGRKDT